MNNKELLGDQTNIEILRCCKRSSHVHLGTRSTNQMSNPAAKERVVRLEESGIIGGYRLELDPKELVMR